MYKKFSDLYDKLVFDIDYKQYQKNIKNIFNEYNIENPYVLEIACGTGNITQYLSRISKNVLAFDYSEEMLNHAYSKLVDVDNVLVLKQDMFKFPYNKYRFDAIISLLDVMNYIKDEKKLEILFSNIYEGLTDGGVFIFDINSKYKLYEILGNNHFVYEIDDIFYTWENTIEDDLIYFDLNFFVKNNDDFYERIEEKQIEKYYSIEYIENLLKKVGFREINYIDEDTGNSFVELKTQRILFSALK